MLNIETNKHSEQHFSLFIKTWKYCGIVLVTEVEGELKQSNPLNVFGTLSGLITIIFSLIIIDNYMQLLVPNDPLCGKLRFRRLTNSKNCCCCFHLKWHFRPKFYLFMFLTKMTRLNFWSLNCKTKLSSEAQEKKLF